MHTYIHIHAYIIYTHMSLSIIIGTYYLHTVLIICTIFVCLFVWGYFTFVIKIYIYKSVSDYLHYWKYKD